LITFLFPGIATSINMHVFFLLLSRIVIYYYHYYCYYYWECGGISQFCGRTTLATPSSADMYWELFPGAPSPVTLLLPFFSILLHYVVLS